MSLNCGIVGLPNVGKSTLFSALTSAPAEAANYPFCTIDPNKGIVAVPDHRLDKISETFSPKKTIPATVEFVDIAGLVKGASQGEGLGNQFLGHIRQVNAILHVVRCFQDENITHVSNTIDPVRDAETINLELIMADLDSVNKKLQQLPKLLKSQDKKVATQAKILKPLLEKVAVHLEEGNLARTFACDEEDKILLNELHLLTLKKQIFICNVDEDGLQEDNTFVLAMKEAFPTAQMIKISGKIEAELAALDSIEERQDFLEALGIQESGLERLITETYRILGLQTYFTAGPQEVRAWTFKKGQTAPETAGIIHTDFQKGFIKADIYHFNDLVEYGSEPKVKENGKLRLEGKEYVVQDGDIIFFKFNV